MSLDDSDIPTDSNGALIIHDRLTEYFLALGLNYVWITDMAVPTVGISTPHG